MSKKRIREGFKKEAETIAGDERLRLSEIIAAKIERLPAFGKARTVALYYPLPDEVSTLPMLAKWRGVKILALPAIENDRMVFREYSDETDLVAGAFGIAQPKRGRVVPPQEIGLMLVPGIAFDPGGRRLGRGKGFYDRYFAQPEASAIYKVGVCQPGRLIDEVPCEPHDAVMDEIVATATAD